MKLINKDEFHLRNIDKSFKNNSILLRGTNYIDKLKDQALMI